MVSSVNNRDLRTMNANNTSRWVKSFKILFAVFILLSLYLFLRQGNYNLSALNKALGSTAVILAGLTLLVGPLSKKFLSLTQFMTIRRHVGLLAFGAAILHVGISFSQISLSIPITFGILAILAWTYMAFISRDSKVIQMGVALWKKHLSFAGVFAFAVIFLHVVFLRYQGWTKWLHGQVKQTPQLLHPSLAPLSVFTFLFMCAVILYRVFVFFKYRNKGKI